MFKFRKSFFIVFDFILSSLIFALIFYLRYIVLSEFFAISSRQFSLLIIIHILIYSAVIVLFNIAMKCY